MEKQLGGGLYSTLRLFIATLLIILSAFGGMAVFHLTFSSPQSVNDRPTDMNPFKPIQKRGQERRFENGERAAQANIVYVTPLLPMNEQVSSCLNNPTRCPMFPAGQLEIDWPLRHSKKSHAACYYEFKNVNPSCPKACDDIFFLNAHDPELSSRVAQACKIGCSYATQAQQDAKETCLFNCKGTIWDYNKGSERCSREYGVGLELPNREPFDIIKACEFGCILGNERVCPWCDGRATGPLLESYV